MASSVLSVRVSSTEKNLLEAAARKTRTNLSDFIRRKALEQAEMEMMDRTSVVIPAAEWETFEAWLNEPAKELPGLDRLFATKPVWEN